MSTTKAPVEMPPHSVPLERIALGVLVGSDGKAFELLHSLDEDMFYQRYHQLLFAGIKASYEENAATDPATCARYVSYLSKTYIDKQPIADLCQFQMEADATVTHPATIIKSLDTFRLQRVMYDIRLEQILPDPNVQIDNVLSKLALARRRYMKPAVDMSEAIRATLEDFDTNIPEITTGITSLDRYIAFRPKSLVLVGARPSGAKGLDVTTPIPTPNGWTTMGELKVGDEIFAADGTVTTVTLVTQPKLIKCFKVCFSDKSEIIADEEHLWEVSTRQSRKSQAALLLPKKRDSKYSHDQRWKTSQAKIVSTSDMAKSYTLKGGRKNFAVANCSPLQLPDRGLPIDPYVLGVWLGDGNSKGGIITTSDDQIFQNINAIRPCRWKNQVRERCRQFLIVGLTTELRALGVLMNKHIPDIYLRASENQRRALLAGLLDTDGTVKRHSGAASFTTTSLVLNTGVRELVQSLGYRIETSQRRCNGKTEASSTAYITAFIPDRPVFRLARKATLQKTARTRSAVRTITSVKETQSVLTRCIKVAHPSALYLASRAFIPTHNTVLATNIAIGAATHGGCEVLFHALEMDVIEMTKRIISRATQVENWRVQRNLMRPNEREKVVDIAAPMANLPIWFRDEDATWPQNLAAYEMMCELRPSIRMILVDYLQLFHGIPGARERHLQIATVLRQMKLFAKRRNVCFIVFAQLNRKAVDKDTEEPELEHFKDSGAAEQDADAAILLHAPQRVENLKKGYDGPEELLALVKKNRNGRLGRYPLYLDRRYGLIKDIPHGGLQAGLEDEQFQPSTVVTNTPVQEEEIDLAEVFDDDESGDDKDLDLGV